MSAALTAVRRMAIEGRHLNQCMADQSLREHGWRLMMRARRIARRLSYSLRAVGVEL